MAAGREADRFPPFFRPEFVPLENLCNGKPPLPRTPGAVAGTGALGVEGRAGPIRNHLPSVSPATRVRLWKGEAMTQAPGKRKLPKGDRETPSQL